LEKLSRRRTDDADCDMPGERQLGSKSRCTTGKLATKCVNLTATLIRHVTLALRIQKLWLTLPALIDLIRPRLQWSAASVLSHDLARVLAPGDSCYAALADAADLAMPGAEGAEAGRGAGGFCLT
jgi:hypothetical protein